MGFFKSNGFSITDMQAALEFLNKNIYLVQLIKNSNIDHPYIKTVFLSTFQNLPFIRPINAFNK
jgi:hypothetical protein